MGPRWGDQGAVAGPCGLAPEPEVVLGRGSARRAHHKITHEVIGVWSKYFSLISVLPDWALAMRGLERAKNKTFISSPHTAKKTM